MTAPLELTSEVVAAPEVRRPVPFFAYPVVARRKLNAPPTWEWYALDGRTLGGGDTIVTGGIPNPGKRGRAKWAGVKGQSVVVTEAEKSAACAEYERETGRCHECGGGGETVACVSVDKPTTYRTCRRCGGNGRPPQVTP